MKNSVLVFSVLLAGMLLSITSCRKNDVPEIEKPDPDDSIPELEVLYDHHTEWTFNLAMYEVNIRQYTSQGTFEAFEEHLPRLKNMGAGILWFMPIQPVGVENRLGSLGSYYSVKDYRDINPEFGTMSDFKELVKKIHGNGMFVIIDWVANHTSWDNILTVTNPDFYDTDDQGNFQPPPGTNWSDVIELDYSNPALADYMIGTLKYWVRETGIDGFRFDAVDFVPSAFWTQATAALKAYKPDIFLLAEGDAAKYHTMGFDMDYCWTLHGWSTGLMRRIYEGSASVSDLNNFLNSERSAYMPNKYHLYFTSNHDENSWEGTDSEQLGESVHAFATLTQTLYGMPLVYSGQEAGLDHRLAFFDKDLIPWGNYVYGDFYTKLMQLKKDNPALWNGEAGGIPDRIDTDRNDNIFAYSRTKGEDQVIVYLNLTDSISSFSVTEESAYGDFTDVFSGVEVHVNSTSVQQIAQWGYQVLVK
jgi:glycosidase